MSSQILRIGIVAVGISQGPQEKPGHGPLKDKPKKCESSLCCKATAKLEEEVKEDMEKEDASLKELLDADSDDQNSE